jgi:hypothetical protein
MRAVACMAVLVVAASGCFGLFEGRPDVTLRATPLGTGPDAWNHDGRVTVEVLEPGHTVRIDAKSGAFRVDESAEGKVTVDLPDGAWTVRYYVDDYLWTKLEDVRIDATPPSLAGLEVSGNAQGGLYVLGSDVEPEAGRTVRVYDEGGSLLNQGLPVTITGLAAGKHVFRVEATEESGNVNEAQVLVRSGTAVNLPPGAWTAGIVARYTKEVQLWDVSARSLMPADAAAEVGGMHLGSGEGIEPEDATVRQIVGTVVEPGMDTTQAAWALYKWMFNTLEYDQGRLGRTDLLSPAETVENGGGVCRDLAALYASLLRAAGIPARLVAGYIASVEEFHAWVEFYAGDQGWVPVDVSPIDGAFETGDALAAFGILTPNLIPLRRVTEDQEQGDWSTAGQVDYQFTGPEPEREFRSRLETDLSDTGRDLCVDPETLERLLAPAGSCPDRFPLRVPGLAWRTDVTMDYGLEVESAGPGTTIELALVFPEGGIEEVGVTWAAYGPGTKTRDDDEGRMRIRWTT